MGPLSWPLPSGRSIPDSPPPRLCSRHLPGRRTASCASDWLSGLPLLPHPLVCPPAPSSPGAHVGRGGANLCVPHVCHICERLSSIHMRDTVSIVPFEVGRSPAGDPARGGRPASAPPMWYTTERAPTFCPGRIVVPLAWPRTGPACPGLSTRVVTRQADPPRLLPASPNGRASSHQSATHKAGAGASATAGVDFGDGGGGRVSPRPQDVWSTARHTSGRRRLWPRQRRGRGAAGRPRRLEACTNGTATQLERARPHPTPHS